MGHVATASWILSLVFKYPDMTARSSGGRLPKTVVVLARLEVEDAELAIGDSAAAAIVARRIVILS